MVVTMTANGLCGSTTTFANPYQNGPAKSYGPSGVTLVHVPVTVLYL
jgi:hypothetical protein